MHQKAAYEGQYWGTNEKIKVCNHVSCISTTNGETSDARPKLTAAERKMKCFDSRRLSSSGPIGSLARRCSRSNRVSLRFFFSARVAKAVMRNDPKVNAPQRPIDPALNLSSEFS